MLNYKKIFLMTFLVFTLLFSIGSNGSAEEFKIITIQHWPIINWEPARMFSYGSRVLSNVYENLLYMDLSEGKEKLIPRLATSYEGSKDGKVWTFKLRKGVKFHNGELFNAESVKFSFDYYKRINKGACFIWESVREVKIIDDHTVQFICDQPAPVDLIVAAQYAAYMLPPKLYKDKELEWFQKGQAVGTGPYKLASWEKGVHTILEKFDDYWGGWKPNRFDKAIFKVVEDASTRMQLLKQGAIDMIEEIPVEYLPDLEANPDIEIFVGPSLRDINYHLNTQKPPTDDINVRKAIHHALNLDLVIEKLYGKGASRAVGPVPRPMWGYAPDLKTYDYDLEKAKELIKKSKYADQLAKGPMKLELTTADHDISMTTSQYIQAALKKIGFEVELDQTPWPAVWERCKNKEKAAQIAQVMWWPTIISPGDYFNPQWLTEEGNPQWNWSYWYNSEFDALFKEARRLEAIDRKKASEIYKKLQRWILDEALTIFVADLNDIILNRKKVKGFKNNPAYTHFIYLYDLHY